MINRRLIEARKARGWTQAYLASQLAVSSITVSRWENGTRAPQAYCVQRLCQIFGLTDRELGFALCQDTTPQEDRMVYEEMDKYFTFGKIKTAELILDGDGTGVYLPQHIHSHYIPVALELPEEFQVRKERVAQEQEGRKAQGDS
jgi:transcriptional regulator with XRE-family HTH domain